MPGKSSRSSSSHLTARQDNFWIINYDHWNEAMWLRITVFFSNDSLPAFATGAGLGESGHNGPMAWLP